MRSEWMSFVAKRARSARAVEESRPSRPRALYREGRDSSTRCRSLGMTALAATGRPHSAFSGSRRSVHSPPTRKKHCDRRSKRSASHGRSSPAPATRPLLRALGNDGACRPRSSPLPSRSRSCSRAATRMGCSPTSGSSSSMNGTSSWEPSAACRLSSHSRGCAASAPSFGRGDCLQQSGTSRKQKRLCSDEGHRALELSAASSQNRS